ncbi:hypothetical protein Hanom_Chr04g00283491 [Helianthus anomalus]
MLISQDLLLLLKGILDISPKDTYRIFKLLVHLLNNVFHALQLSKNCILTKLISNTKHTRHLPLNITDSLITHKRKGVLTAKPYLFRGSHLLDLKTNDDLK